MKIAIITNSSLGLFNFRQELLLELAQENEVVAITPDSGCLQEIVNLGCRVIEISLDRRGINPLKDLFVLSKYRKILRCEKPDLVITYTIKPNIYGGIAANSLKIPYAGNITGLGTAFQNKGLLKTLVTFLYKFAYKNAKVVFFENEENRDIFVNEGIISKNKTCILAGAGVNLDRYTVTEYPRGEVTNFLFMGRVMKEKGIDELFSAMKKLVGDGEKVHLDVLGSYEERYQSIIEQHENEGWLTYHGYQKDVRSFISNAHCFVLPSWHEGMANTNLECAACGRPVITSNIHGCLEAVENGISGFLVQKKDPDELYCIMKNFIELPFDDKKKMGLEGRKRMEKIFDKNIVVEQTIEQLKEK